MDQCGERRKNERFVDISRRCRTAQQKHGRSVSYESMAGFQRRIYVCATHSLHSEEMSTSNEELLEPL